MEPDKTQTPQVPTPDPTSLDAILAEGNKTNEAIDPSKLQDAVNSGGHASKEQNPYFDQQVKVGQIIGYGVPTDQKVVIPVIKPKHTLSKKFMRRVLLCLLIALLIAGVITLVLLGKKVATP